MEPTLSDGWQRVYVDFAPDSQGPISFFKTASFNRSAIRHPCVEYQSLPAPSVTFAVTTDAKRNQVVHHIATELAPAVHVMDLQVQRGTTFLTPPTISFQDPVSDYCVFFRVQLEPRLLLT